MIPLKKNFSSIYSILSLMFLLFLVISSSKAFATRPPNSLNDIHAISEFQYHEMIISKGGQHSFSLGEKIAKINQTAFYLNITVLVKSNGTVFFNPKYFDFNPTPESFILGLGESKAENYTWLGTSPDDEVAKLKFVMTVLTGTNATIRVEYAFLRNLTAPSPGFEYLSCLIVIMVVVLWKKVLTKTRE